MHDHVLGNAKAPVVLVEYADFECPYCGMAFPYVKRAESRFRDDLAVIFRPFPIPEIHPHAMHAAQAAEAAGLQQRFWEMHDMMFEHQDRLDDDALLGYARAIGLDLDRFKRDFSSQKVIEDIAESRRRGERDGVEGTPAFFLNGEMLELENFQDLETAIQSQVSAIQARKR